MKIAKTAHTCVQLDSTTRDSGDMGYCTVKFFNIC